MKSIVGIVILLVVMVPSVWAEDRPIATLEPIQGEILLKVADSDLWMVVTTPTQVNAGDEIRTGTEGWAVLTFFEGTYTEILANTELIIQALSLPENEGDSFTINLELRIGDTFNTVGALLDQESGFEVEMPGMTASVRGTEWYNRVIPTGCSMVYTVVGEVATFSDLNADEPIGVKAGEFIVYNLDGTLDEDLQPEFPPRRPAEAPLAPQVCLDGTCEADEIGVGELESCGDGICQVAEGLLTCSADCSSILDVEEDELERRMELFFNSED